MVSRNKNFKRGAAGLLGLALLVSTALAGPSIDAWDLQSAQSQERLRIRWSEPATVEMHEFPAARQVVVKIPGATLSNTGLPALNTSSSRVMQNARIQEVTFDDGREGVQLTLSMSRYHKPEMVATARFLSLTYNTASHGQPQPTSQENAPRLLLSNADFDAIEGGASFGSASSPSTGAGQAPAGNTINSPFFIPEDLTPEQRDPRAPALDRGMLATQELFDRQVDLDFKDADLQNIIRSIARRLSLNIIMMPNQVRGNVTVSLTNVRLGDALEAMLRANDLAYSIEQGGIVRIVPRSQVRASDKELVTRAISINWIDAADISSIINSFVSSDGTVEYSRESNVVIVKDVPEAVAEIQELIGRLDVPEKQVRMEVRMVDMSESAERSLGIRTNLTSRRTRTYTMLDEGGFDPTNPEFVVRPEYLGNIGVLPDTRGFFDFTMNEDINVLGARYDVDMRIRAQEDRGEAVTLAAPTILSLNNVPASIEIKRQIPYQDAVTSTQGQFATIKFADVGTKVELRPRITNNGFVSMEITPEQKILVGTEPTTGVPIIDERFALTSVTVKDEQTIALGGLRQFETTASEAGVPWIMRTPVLGWLFKNQTNTQNKLELYLFVTPSIIKDPEPTSYEYGLYEKIDYNWDLPDFYFDEVRARKSPRELEGDPYPTRR